MTLSDETKVIQITNIAPSATREQMKQLFTYVGKIDELRLYPEGEASTPGSSRVCYVKYDDPMNVGVAMHLTNTVFVDRAMIVVPVHDGKIPNEEHAMQLAAPGSLNTGLPSQNSTWPSNVVNQLVDLNGMQMITTKDPKLVELGLTNYPPLPATTEPQKMDEIRRTIYVSSLDQNVMPDQLISFFSQVGEVKWLRMAGDDVVGKASYVEFSHQTSVPTALTFNGVMFNGRPISITHALTAINKPSQTGREVEEAMKKVKEAQSLISAAAEAGRLTSQAAVAMAGSQSLIAAAVEADRTRSRSRSPRRKRRSRSRHRSRDRSKRSRSRSKRSRSRKRSRERTKRSRSRHRSRSRRRKSRSKSKSRKGTTVNSTSGPSQTTSRDRRKRSRSRHRSSSRSRHKAKRSRSKSRERRRRSRSRKRSKSRERRRRSRSRSKGRSRRSRSRSRKRSRSRGRSKSPRKRSRSHSRERDRRHKKDRKRDRSRDRSRDRDRSKERDRKKKKDKERDREKEKEKDKDKSEVKIKRDYDEEEKDFAGKKEKSTDCDSARP